MSFSKVSRDTTFTLESLNRPAEVSLPSPFTGHQLRVTSTRNLEHRQYPADWILAALILCLAALAFLRVFYYKRFRQISLAPLSRRHLNILIKEGNLFRERISIALLVVYLFSFSYMMCLVLNEFFPQFSKNFKDHEQFLICCAAMIIYWSCKIIVIRYLGMIFITGQTTHEYVQNILAFAFMTGVMMFPIVVLILFIKSDVLLYITISLAILMFVFRLIRGLFIGISLKKFSYLFLFVYLCSLEILPLLVILKGFYMFSKGF